MILTARECFETDVRASRDRLIALCRTLVRTRSENPPGDTSEIATLVEAVLNDVPDLEIRRFVAKEPAVNLLVRLKGSSAAARPAFISAAPRP